MQTREVRIEYVALNDLRRWPRNPKNHADDALEASFRRWGFVEPLTVDETTGRIVAGHGRLGVLSKMRDDGDPPPNGVQVGEADWLVPVLRGVAFDSEREAEAYLLASNRLVEAGGWDNGKLLAMLDDVIAEAPQLDGIGFGMADVEALRALADAPPAPPGTSEETVSRLMDRFIVPPFTVLDARQGYWQERKRAWESIGIRGKDGRGEDGFGCVSIGTERSGFGPDYDCSKGENAWGGSATSIFDSVLVELVYRWFNVPEGQILDPFAGESVKGAVAGWLGYGYCGVELRPEQVAINREQWAGIRARFPNRTLRDPEWIVGDSAKIADIAPKGLEADLIFTSPPYYDLERYSERTDDGSAMPTYESFMGWYRGVFQAAVARLKENRFLVVKVGEIRDRTTGIYRNFLGDNIRCFLDLGLAYYNEAVLVTPVGSLPLRTARAFQSARKLGKGHQNVLIFFKGDPREVSKNFPSEVECAAVSSEGAES